MCFAIQITHFYDELPFFQWLAVLGINEQPFIARYRQSALRNALQTLSMRGSEYL